MQLMQQIATNMQVIVDICLKFVIYNGGNFWRLAPSFDCIISMF